MSHALTAAEHSASLPGMQRQGNVNDSAQYAQDTDDMMRADTDGMFDRRESADEPAYTLQG